MKLLPLALIIVALVPLVALAQGEPGTGKHSLGANAELSLPMGDFSNAAGTGYGGNLRYQYGYDRRSAFTATAGYLVWSKKDITANTTGQPSAFSIFLGGKYYVTEGFFASLEGGLYFLDYNYEGVVVGLEGSTTTFMLPIGVGYQSSGFEVAVRYMVLDIDVNEFSFTVGYNFGL